MMHQTLIKREYVMAALTADRGHDAELLSWTAHEFTEPGENTAAFLMCLEVEFSQNGKNDRINYIAKLNPLRTENWTDFIRMSFQKEVGFYEELGPALTTQMKAAGLDGLRFPRCFFFSLKQDGEVIIQEDLRTQGFRKCDRMKTLDISHATIALQELARLHAASLVLKTKLTKDIQSKYDDFLSKHWSSFKIGAEEIYCTLMSDNLENVKVVLQKMEGYERAAEWVENLKSKVLSIFQEQTATTPQFAVVCHFDLVNNNLLFRYNEHGKPIEVKILDFQMCYTASLATDITDFVYNCLSGSDRKTHLDDFLSSYYASFSRVLQACDSPIPFTYKQLQEEYKSKLLFGVMSSLYKLPFIVAEDNEILDMDNYDNQTTFTNTQQRNMMIMFDRNKSFHDRLLSIFDDLGQFGMLT
ncbi:uncharacterized protein LOC121864073 [Homarus americanus]|uniref:Putative Ecdysteroid kinase-containing protein 12 n=1 Tax=Homarus americanus TaxID=6706 RepID=A0A8J5KIU0_HOMAM|nr:uncharacterized protein LOC121864073 [Homarus americanus]XP_042218910.1 uncharacterized protein LOC121864073 [Homarus americanus]KAG7170770.1 putative Ecdysteroid kinase-containing protein 12 [Homarus americanus]